MWKPTVPLWWPLPPYGISRTKVVMAAGGVIVAAAVATAAVWLWPAHSHSPAAASAHQSGAPTPAGSAPATPGASTSTVPANQLKHLLSANEALDAAQLRTALERAARREHKTPYHVLAALGHHGPGSVTPVELSRFAPGSIAPVTSASVISAAKTIQVVFTAPNAPGTSVTLTVYRNGKPSTTTTK